MFAVVRTGGKQYRVAAGDRIVVEKLDGDAGASITLGDILLAGEGSDLKPTDGLTVAAEIVAQAKADKVIVFKKRRRHNYRRKNGHRQQHTILKILSIGGETQRATEPASQVEASDATAPAAAPASVNASVEAQGAPVETQATAPKAAAPKKPAATPAATNTDAE